jgi:hypothetical protein
VPLDLTPIPLGTDLQVNTFTADQQRYPSIAALAAGGFVVTWSSLSQDGPSWGIYGQRYDATGATAGAEFQVNTVTFRDQLYSSVAALADGGFVVTWSSLLQDGSGYGIYGQRYDADGATAGAEFQVNTETAGDQHFSSVAALADGGFVVTWSSNGQDGDGYGIFGQRYDATGATAGDEFPVNTTTRNVQIYSSVAALADGGFVVTWSSFDQDGSGYGIYGQRYDATGATARAEFRVNTETASSQVYSSVAALADGGFVVTWSSSGQDGDLYGIFGQRYDGDGATAGAEFQVNTVATSAQDYSSVAALADGGFVVTWSSDGQDGDRWGVYGQRYDATGATAGDAFRLNNITTGQQITNGVTGAEFVAELADGRLVATWSGFAAEEVFVRLFDVPNTPPQGTDGRITLDEDTRHVFAAADFGFTDDDAGATFFKLRIDTLPAAGALTLDGVAVAKGQEIAAADLGKLAYTPEANANGPNFASLTFSVSDGSAFDPTPNRLTFDVTPLNDGLDDPTPIPLGTDIQVNATTADQQLNSSIAALSDGGFVVTWSSLLQDGSGYGIFGQRYDATGAEAGGEFRVNTVTTNDQRYSSVAALADGGFVVTWSSGGNQDGSFSGVYGQRYDATGAKAGAEFQVNTATSSDQQYSSVAALADGGFVVTWTSFDQDGSSFGIYGQRYGATGVTVGDEFKVNTTTADSQYYSSVAALADGGFVVTWTSFGQDGSGEGIFGQRYDANGAANGGEFQANTATLNRQDYASVAGLSDGGFVVTWSSLLQDGSGWGIHGQRYDANGAPAGDEFQANTETTDWQIYSSVAPLADGGFFVTWSSFVQDRNHYGVYGQRYDARGTKAGTEFRLNDIVVGDQANESFYGAEFVAQLADGRLVATWSGFGETEEVFVRLIDVPNTPPQGTDGRITLNENSSHVFAAADFGFTDDDAGATFFKLRIDTLPAAGALTLDGVAVAPGQEIAAADLGKLAYTPEANADGPNFASLTFSVSDGSAFDPTPNRLTFDVTPVFDAVESPTPSPLGTDIQVNTFTTDQQRYPSIAALAAGGFVVTWSSNGQDGNRYGIFGQRYDATGGTAGTEFQVNTFTTSEQLYPSVAALADGGFVVTWSSFVQDGLGWGLYGQRYAATGAKAGTEFQVNATTPGWQLYSSVAAFADGGFVVNWSSQGQDGSGWGIYGQRYDATGATAGAEFLVNTTTASDQYLSSVAPLADGGFVVTWSSSGQDGDGYGIFGQRYDATGATVGTEFQVNTVTTNDQLYSSVAALADGGFVVTWTSNGQDGNRYGIFGQRYDATGGTAGTEFQVNTYWAFDQHYSSVAALADGGFVVTWSSLGQDGDGSGIYGQRYDATGATAGDEFRLNDITTGQQFNDSFYGSEFVAQLADGRLVATWSGTGNEEVFVRLFDVPNTPPQGTDGRITLDEDTRHVFAAADFGFTDDDAGDVLASMRIDTLPAAGALTLDGVAVAKGQEIAAADLGKLAYTPEANANGPNFASLTFSVSDGSAFDPTPNTLVFDVTPVNDAPVVANAIADQSVAEDTHWSFTLPANTFADVDSALTYTATRGDGTALPAWLTFTPGTRTFSGTPPENFNGAIDLKVTATDGTLTASDTFTLTVESVNDAPVVANAIADQSVAEDTHWSFTLPANTFADVDSALTYTATRGDGTALPAWLTFTPGTRTFSGTPPENFNGAIDLKVTATDGTLTASDTFTLTVESVNDAPVVANAIADQSVAEDTHWSFTLPANTFADVDSALTYTATRGDGTALPAWLTFTPGTRTFSGTPPENFNGAIDLKVTATDGTLTASDTFTLTVESVNDAPVVANAIADQSVAEDTHWSFTLPANTFADVDSALTYTATRGDGTALPAWLTFTPGTRTFSGTPPENFNGAIDLKVTATDGTLTASDTFTLTVESVNDAPVVANAIADQSVAEDTHWSFTLPANTFADVDSALSYTASLADDTALPTWLTFDAGTRTFTGTPPANFNGPIDLKVTASDGALTANDTFRLNVTPVNDAPTVANAIADQSVDEDTAWSFTVPANTFADVDSTLSYTASLADDTALPAWLTFNTGTRTFSGTPPENFNGPIDLKVTASDGALAASDTFTLTVEPVNDAPTVANAIADQSVDEDTDWSFTVPANTFADVDSALSYTASLADDTALPTWLTFDAGTRTFTGTPPENFNGTIDLKVTATDGTLTANDTFTLTVTPVNDAPTVATAIPDQSVDEDTDWSFTVPANTFADVDSALSYTASLADDTALPTWLTFDAGTRTFTGTPAGEFQRHDRPQGDGDRRDAHRKRHLHLDRRVGERRADGRERDCRPVGRRGHGLELHGSGEHLRRRRQRSELHGEPRRRHGPADLAHLRRRHAHLLRHPAGELQRHDRPQGHRLRRRARRERHLHLDRRAGERRADGRERDCRPVGRRGHGLELHGSGEHLRRRRQRSELHGEPRRRFGAPDLAHLHPGNAHLLRHPAGELQRPDRPQGHRLRRRARRERHLPA